MSRNVSIPPHPLVDTFKILGVHLSEQNFRTQWESGQCRKYQNLRLGPSNLDLPGRYNTLLGLELVADCVVGNRNVVETCL